MKVCGAIRAKATASCLTVRTLIKSPTNFGKSYTWFQNWGTTDDTLLGCFCSICLPAMVAGLSEHRNYRKKAGHFCIVNKRPV